MSSDHARFRRGSHHHGTTPRDEADGNPAGKRSRPYLAHGSRSDRATRHASGGLHLRTSAATVARDRRGSPRRSGWRVWAGQCPMASYGAVSMAAKRSDGCRGLIQINAATRLPPKVSSWHQDGFPKSKLPRSPLSFSAWLCSPSSCCPLGERSSQDEQITGDSMKAGVRQG